MKYDHIEGFGPSLPLRAFNPQCHRMTLEGGGGGGKGGSILGVVAMIAMPVMAPALAETMAASEALSGTAFGEFLGSQMGSMAVGAALGGVTSAVTGGNPLLGMIGGGLAGYGGFDASAAGSTGGAVTNTVSPGVTSATGMPDVAGITTGGTPMMDTGLGSQWTSSTGLDAFGQTAYPGQVQSTFGQTSALGDTAAAASAPTASAGLGTGDYANYAQGATRDVGVLPADADQRAALSAGNMSWAGGPAPTDASAATTAAKPGLIDRVTNSFNSPDKLAQAGLKVGIQSALTPLNPVGLDDLTNMAKGQYQFDQNAATTRNGLAKGNADYYGAQARMAPDFQQQNAYNGALVNGSAQADQAYKQLLASGASPDVAAAEKGRMNLQAGLNAQTAGQQGWVAGRQAQQGWAGLANGAVGEISGMNGGGYTNLANAYDKGTAMQQNWGQLINGIAGGVDSTSSSGVKNTQPTVSGEGTANKGKGTG